MSTAKSNHFVGVDLGGTKIMAGVFDQNLECLGWAKISTKSQRGPVAVIDRISRCVVDAVDECDLKLDQVRGIGLGAPGSVDPESGRVVFAPNLGWENVSLRKELEKRLERPVAVDNDCNICTLGVYEKELDSKPQHVVGIFLGTGIGGGLVVNGQPYGGFNRTAGEVGHMVIDINGPKCRCGNRGCFEALASRTAVFQRIRAAVKEGQKTLLTEMLGEELEELRSGHLRKAIRRGDKLTERIIKEVGEYAGIAVANLINVLSPEVVVIGGGLMEALEEELIEVIQTKALQSAMPGTTKGVSIRASRLGDDAGIVGGAVLARRMTKG